MGKMFFQILQNWVSGLKIMKFLGDSAHVKVQYWYAVCKVGSISAESFVKETFSFNIKIII